MYPVHHACIVSKQMNNFFLFLLRSKLVFYDVMINKLHKKIYGVLFRSFIVRVFINLKFMKLSYYEYYLRYIVKLYKSYINVYVYSLEFKYIDILMKSFLFLLFIFMSVNKSILYI